MVETEAYDCKSQYLFKPDSEHELNREAQGLTLQLSHTITGQRGGQESRVASQGWRKLAQVWRKPPKLQQLG